MINLLFALIGLLTGGLINALADDLPRRTRLQRPHCPKCGHVYSPSGWLAVGRRLWGGGRCPECGLPTRKRALLTEVSTAVLFAFLPSLITVPQDLIINTIYIAILILVIVIDMEHKLILHVVTVPATIFALAASFIVTDNNIKLALAGAVTGFVLFYIAFWLGQLLFGPGALGFGDVMLSMAMGAMLGFHRILFRPYVGDCAGGAGQFDLVT